MPALLATGLACSLMLERSGSCLKEPTPTPSGPSVMADAALVTAGPASWPFSRNMEGGAAMVGVVAACAWRVDGEQTAGWEGWLMVARGTENERGAHAAGRVQRPAQTSNTVLNKHCCSPRTLTMAVTSGRPARTASPKRLRYSSCMGAWGDNACRGRRAWGFRRSLFG